MHEILRNLHAGSLVLDLGCAEGSFPQDITLATVVRVDRQTPKNQAGRPGFVQGDAAALPFADQTFAAVISNHSIEHFDDLPSTLCEIGRVICAGGSLFVAVPDASTLTDNSTDGWREEEDMSMPFAHQVKRRVRSSGL